MPFLFKLQKSKRERERVKGRGDGKEEARTQEEVGYTEKEEGGRTIKSQTEREMRHELLSPGVGHSEYSN